MKIREALESYHEEYKKDREALGHAESAIKDLKARTGGDDLSRKRGSLLQGRYRTIGESIVRRYVGEGGIRLIGERIESPEKLAAIMQAYRNPLFETMRLIYLKDGFVVSCEGYSNHLPELVVLPYENEEFVEHIVERMHSLSADGYYMVHNHPSGIPKPSFPDCQLTYTVARHTEGFLGHIVTNHVKYGLIDADGDYDIMVMDSDEKDRFAGASIEHPLLGEVVNSSSKIASLARDLHMQENTDVSNLIYLTTKGEIRMVQEVSNNIFQDGNLKVWLGQELHSVGAVNACCITTNMEVYDACTPLMEERYLADAIFIDPDYPFYWSRMEAGVEGKDQYLSAGVTKKDLSYHTTCEEKNQGEAEKPCDLQRAHFNKPLFR